MDLQTMQDPERMDSRLLREERLDGYLVHDIEAFVGDNSRTYIDKFRAVEAGKPTFHLTCGLFTGIWLSYRRLWKLMPAYLLFTQMVTSLCLMVEITVMKLFLNAPAISDALVGVTGLAQGLCFVLVGLFGYKLYWMHVKSQLDRYNCQNRPPILDLTLEEKLSRAGGCNYIYIIGGVLFNIVNNYVSQFIGQLMINLFL